LLHAGTIGTAAVLRDRIAPMRKQMIDALQTGRSALHYAT